MLKVLGSFSPIESPKQLRDPFLSFRVSSRGQLDSKSRDRTIVSMHTEPSPTIAMRSAVLELVPELLDLNEVLIIVLVLLQGVSSIAGPHNRYFTPQDIVPVPQYRRTWCIGSRPSSD